MKIISIIDNFSNEKHVGQGEIVDKTPLFTTLPDTAMLRNNDPFYLPAFSSRVDCGVQLIVKISRVVKSIEQRFAERCYDEIGVAVNFTARDLYQRLQREGVPTDMARSFDKSIAISPCFIDKGDVNLCSLNFELSINGEVKQSASMEDMRYSIDEIISGVSKFITLKIGDMILCGAPSSAIEVSAGDIVVSKVGAESMLNFEIR